MFASVMTMTIFGSNNDSKTISLSFLQEASLYLLELQLAL